MENRREYLVDLTQTLEEAILTASEQGHSDITQYTNQFYETMEELQKIPNTEIELTEVKRQNTILRGAMEEIARKPYNDSDVSSLLEWITERAESVLKQVSGDN
jgi:hypothetical protein